MNYNNLRVWQIEPVQVVLSQMHVLGAMQTPKFNEIQHE